jgi:precorrin-3B synthase
MSAPIIQGWCPGALRPMLSGDGLVVRIRPRGGRLAQSQVAGIADLAAKHGNGLIDLSARANLQLRGVTDGSYDALMAGLQGLGLLDISAEAEARRNILVTPFWQDGDGAQDIAQGLSLALAWLDAPDVPGKFGFAVDTGEVPVLGAASADIRIERVEAGLICRADGAATGARVTQAGAVKTAIRLAHWFVESGGAPDGRGRMAAHLADGAVLPAEFKAVSVKRRVVPAPAPGPHLLGYLVGLEFGQIEAETLAQLAKLGPVRVTPWRMFLIEGLGVAPDLPGLIVRADDALLRVVACTGAPGCPQALQPTRGLARALAGHVPKGALLHVSGCAKGCAMPKAAAMTLVGQSAGFGLVPMGFAGDMPQHNGLTAEALAADPGILMGRH